MAMQSYATAPGRNTAKASGPPKGLIGKEMMMAKKEMMKPKMLMKKKPAGKKKPAKKRKKK